MYKCIHSFTANNGKHYSRNQMVDQFSFLNLSHSERKNFVIVFEEEDDDITYDEFGGEG